MIDKIKLFLKRLCWGDHSKPLEFNKCPPALKEEDCQRINGTTEKYFIYTLICIILACAAFFSPVLIFGSNTIHFPGIVIFYSSTIIATFGAMFGAAWARSRDIINLLNGDPRYAKKG